ncbi:DUF6449 domain-containing protein [Butyrivibrio sp. YAB3001]|uniref:DUF6449 domain-containing protein n=1 Tax=Butyrivibrio sp. YAB3001 TaxID=1520812 RepID=UPI0008F6830D|nr:DUF6449 domain-containing protein [Butyrivibrio sp. YAB3001]SFC36788.1 ABC-2 type transport system permease protein [Butyrivibrio sp. YAB3001]
MTSANLSLADRFSNHKKYISRTLWSSYIGFVIMAVYYVLGVMLILTRALNYGRMYNQAPEVLRREKYVAVTSILGFEQLGWIIVVALAIVFAFQGFNYLFDQKKIDFYLSQPTTRAERLTRNYINAITTFAAMYIITNGIALIIAAFFGAVNKVVLLTALIETARIIVLFFAVYSITVLAIMLTGSFPIALLVLAFFLAISVLFGGELIGYKNIFYDTYAARESVMIGSPIYDRYVLTFQMRSLRSQDWFNTSLESITKCFGYFKNKDIDTFIVGIIAFIFVIVFSKFRRAEHAGKTIVYRPFRWFLKIVLCIVIGLGAGVVLYVMYDFAWSTSVYVIMFIVMIISGLFSGCILEAILDGNIRSILKGMPQTILALAITSLIFVIFKGDLLGYDSFVPERTKIESCAILESGYDYQLYTNGENTYGNDSEENMKITDTDTFCEVVRIGMQTKKEEAKSSRTGKYKNLGNDTTVLFRMKNGKKIYRSITIPYDIDSALFSKLIDSKEYKEGCFSVFFDDKMRAYDMANRKTTSMQYMSVSGNRITTDLSYAELSDAYRKDIEKYFSYEMVGKSIPIGRIEYSNSSNDGYASCDFDVFECYENTIALLKKYGIFTEDKLDVQNNVASVSVTNYYPGVDSEKEDIDISNTSVEEKTVTYTDRDKIVQILENARCREFYNKWYNDTDYLNSQYSISVETKSAVDSYGSRTVFYSFEVGKVPDFVYSDTN